MTADPNQMSFLQHLEELRSRMLRIAVALVIGFIVSWPLSGEIYGYLAEPVKGALPEGARLAYTGISDPFLLYTKLSVFAALLLALPYALFEFWMFVSPGLHAREKKLVIPFVLVATAFFFTGAVFAHKIIVPFAASYFISLAEAEQLQPVIEIGKVFSFVTRLILATGAVFELPVLIFFLTRIGIVTPAFLWHYFGYAFFAIWALAAFMTPPDVVSMVMVATPMTLLYLLGILVSHLFRPKS